MPKSPPLKQPKTPPKTPGGANATCSPDSYMTCPLLLDEMFSGSIAQHLNANGHDALAAVADPALIALPDDQILGHATAWIPASQEPSNGSPGGLSGTQGSAHKVAEFVIGDGCGSPEVRRLGALPVTG
jgi:hypothetical protein